MTPFEIGLVLYAAVLAAAALGVVYRMIVGPTILDRALSSDSLVTLVVMGMALYVAQSGAAWAAPVMLALTGMAFIGTVTFARFVAREDHRPGPVLHSHPDEPPTETGGHEAMHLTPAGADADAAEGTVDDADGFGAGPAEEARGFGAGAEGFGADVEGLGADAEGFGADPARADGPPANLWADDGLADPGANRWSGDGLADPGADPGSAPTPTDTPPEEER